MSRSDAVSRAGSTSSGVDTSVPHSARIYDWWLGGKDNFAVDRATGAAMLEAIPTLRMMAAENRRFVHRMARFLVAIGWELVEPGIVPVPAWRPDGPPPTDPEAVYYWAGVACKP